SHEVSLQVRRMKRNMRVIARKTRARASNQAPAIERSVQPRSVQPGRLNPECAAMGWLWRSGLSEAPALYQLNLDTTAKPIDGRFVHRAVWRRLGGLSTQRGSLRSLNRINQ